MQFCACPQSARNWHMKSNLYCMCIVYRFLANSECHGVVNGLFLCIWKLLGLNLGLLFIMVHVILITVTISLNSINQPVFVTEIHLVFWEVGTELLILFKWNLCFRGLSICFSSVYCSVLTKLLYQLPGVKSLKRQ